MSPKKFDGVFENTEEIENQRREIFKYLISVLNTFFADQIEHKIEGEKILFRSKEKEFTVLAESITEKEGFFRVGAYLKNMIIKEREFHFENPFWQEECRNLIRDIFDYDE